MLAAFLAQTDTPEIVEPRQSDLNWILIAGMLQPFLVTFLTKKNVSPGTLRIANAVMAAIVGAANAVYEDQQHGGPFDWKRAMIVSVGVWLTSATAYVHLWKDTAALNKIDQATENFGVGKKNAAVPVTNQEILERVEDVGQVVVDATPANPVAQAPVSSPPVDVSQPITIEAPPDRSTAEITGSDRFRWTFTAEPVVPLAGPPPPPPVPSVPNPPETS
jgi:hypothetical protein